MLESIFGSRSRPAPNRHRSRPSSHASRSTGKLSKAAQGDNEVKEAVDKKPNVEELRRRRQTYYGLSASQRRHIATSGASTSKIKSSRPSSTARSSVRKDGVRRRKKPASNSSSKSKTSETSRSRNRVEDFVYVPSSEPVTQDDAATDNVGRESERRQRDSKRDGSEKRQSIRHTSSKRRSLPTVIETEVSPDDSISQVAEQREERHAQQSRKAHARPSMRRSATTASKLPSVAEIPDADPQPTPSSKRSSKRASLQAPPAPPRRHSTTSVPSPTKLVDCLTCGSDDIPLPKSAELSCGHRMCHDCLKRIFSMSVKDPAHMPPKCCTDDDIPLQYVDKLFDTKFKVLWNRKYQEYHTKNRIYCPTAKCGEWIKPKHVHKSGVDGRKYALCPRCKTKVCTLCNNKMHKSSDCPKDPEIAKLVEQAKEKGWQRCFSCNAMVELQSGCNHMTCRCMAEFCMLCGAQWKTCNCPWFNYSQIPNPDQLGDMRVPEPVRVLFRRVMENTGPPPARANARQAHPAAAGPPPEVTYQQELDDRQRQERADAELARRLQLASLWDDEPPARRRAPPGADNTWGIGNAAGHFLNDDFVQNAANVVMNAFGDANFGRRGERSSGRRRRARQFDGGQGQNERDAGLVPNFLGDESVLGAGPATRRR